MPTMNRYFRGFASIPAIIFILVTVTLVMTKVSDSTGSRIADNVVQSDGLAAFFLAESGIEAVTAQLSKATSQDAYNSICNAIGAAGSTSPTLGRGTIGYKNVSSATSGDTTSCVFRATGTVNSASRTIERTLAFAFLATGDGSVSQPTTDGTKSITGTFNIANTSDSDMVALLFSSNKLVKDKVALSAPGSGSGTSYVDIASSTSVDSVEASVIGQTLSPGSSAQLYQQFYTAGTTSGSTVAANRNYAQLAAVVGSSSSTPRIRGVYAATTDNTSNKFSTSTTFAGKFVSGSARDDGSSGGYASSCTGMTGSSSTRCFCYRADLILYGIGVSTVATNLSQLPAFFASIALDSDSNPSYQMTRLGYFPSTITTSTGQTSDVITEIWYFFNPYFIGTVSTTLPIDVIVPSGSVAGEIKIPVTLYSGSNLPKKGAYVGFFEPPCEKRNCIPSTSQITADPELISGTSYYIRVSHPNPASAPISNMRGIDLCGGICALSQKPFDGGAANPTRYSVTRTTQATGVSAKELSSGFICVSDSGGPPRVVTAPKLVEKKWREITSSDQ